MLKIIILLNIKILRFKKVTFISSDSSGLIEHNVTYPTPPPTTVAVINLKNAMKI